MNGNKMTEQFNGIDQVNRIPLNREKTMRRMTSNSNGICVEVDAVYLERIPDFISIHHCGNQIEHHCIQYEEEFSSVMQNVSEFYFILDPGTIIHSRYGFGYYGSVQ